MGRLLVVWRLAARDVRRHPGEAAAFVLAVTVALATLTLGLLLSSAASTGYARTRAATAGPDVIATMTEPSHADRLAHASGVIAHAGPFFAYSTLVSAHGRAVRSAVEGRDVAPAAVDRPLVTAGTWLRPGGAVVERGFAQAWGVRVGDDITVGGRDFPVVGLAISAAQAVYPWGDFAQGAGPSDLGGVVWLTSADARAAAGAETGVYVLHLRLADPAGASRFIDTASDTALLGDTWAQYLSWQDVAHDDAHMIRFTVPALVVGGLLLTVAATVGLAALVASRTARQRRRTGLLKVVGATPGLVSAAMLAQYLPLTLPAAGLGVAVGALLAPLLADPSAGLLVSVGMPPGGVVLTAVAIALAVSLAGMLGPALRAARTSTVEAVGDHAYAPPRGIGLTGVVAHLPTAWLLGVQLLARRPGRALLTLLGAAATTLMITAVLVFAALPDQGLDLGASTLTDIRQAQSGQVLLAVTAALGLLSTCNTAILGWATASQARRALTIARTLGATPGQVIAGVCVAQLPPAIAGAVLGVPAGLGLYWLLSVSMTMPSTAALAAAAVAVPMAIMAVTAVPAWVHTRSTVGSILRAS